MLWHRSGFQEKLDRIQEIRSSRILGPCLHQPNHSSLQRAALTTAYTCMMKSEAKIGAKQRKRIHPNKVISTLYIYYTNMYNNRIPKLRNTNTLAVDDDEVSDILAGDEWFCTVWSHVLRCFLFLTAVQLYRYMTKSLQLMYLCLQFMFPTYYKHIVYITYRFV